MHSLILSQLLLMRLLCLVMLDQFEGPWFSTLKSQLSINYQQSHPVKNWLMTGISKWTTAFWFFLQNTACVQWKFPLDTSGFGHMSKSGHVSTIQCVKWKLSLDTNQTIFLLKRLCKSMFKRRVDKSKQPFFFKNHPFLW